MNTSFRDKTPSSVLHDDHWQPRPKLIEAMRQIAMIAIGDETAVISDREISFQNAGERTMISAAPINVDTVDGLTITDIITIRTPLTSFKFFDENNYAFINVFATTGAVVRGAGGKDAIISRLPLFEGDDEALADLYTPLIANGSRVQTVGPYCGLCHNQGRREEYDAAAVALSGWNEPSYWGTDEFANAAVRLRQHGAYANAGPSGLTVEFPWEQEAISTIVGDSTSMLEIRADVPHPAAGNGLFYRLNLPLNLSDEEAKSCATRLNRAEADGIDTPPFFGAWCTMPASGTLSFGGFWPNLLYKRGTVTNIAFWSWARSRFARQLLGNVLVSADEATSEEIEHV